MADIKSGKGPRAPGLVGQYIRNQREAIGLSQRALGLQFSPPVTTQFISNLERGVTPLPPTHIPTLCKALKIAETELRTLLEKEYALKLSGRLAQVSGGALPQENLMESLSHSISVLFEDFQFFNQLYSSYRSASPEKRSAFQMTCEQLLGLSKPSLSE